MGAEGTIVAVHWYTVIRHLHFHFVNPFDTLFENHIPARLRPSDITVPPFFVPTAIVEEHGL